MNIHPVPTTATPKDTTLSAILILNGGSSSIKFAVVAAGDARERILTGQIERIGSPEAKFTINDSATEAGERPSIRADTHRHAADSLATYLHRRLGSDAIVAIGHRVVHGGIHLLDHQIITADVMAELRRSQGLDMSHLPGEIALIDACGELFPGRPQIACFDTAFHQGMPAVAKLLPIPRELTEAGIRRFGFHGLSFTSLMEQLAALSGPDAARGRIILAHLGAGASMVAVRGGKPVDTTMAFTPTAGLLMATRPGDLDPGLLVYLLRERNMTADDLDDFISHKCGLLGISQTSSDMRDLLAARATDHRAAEAVEAFCYQAKKHLGALISVLGGLDTLVFSGGIGEHLPEVRAGICEGLEFWGIKLDSSRNVLGAAVPSTEDSRVEIRVIATDEEAVMVRIIGSILRL